MNTKNSLMLLAALSGLIILIVVAQPAVAYQAECSGCHLQQYNKMIASNHSTLACEICHEGADAHFLDQGTPKTVFPKVHFDMEVCKDCHSDQYSTFLKDVPGRTFYGGGLNPAGLWSKTSDMPYWNALIDGHPFVLETYEDRNMMYNGLDAMETIRPKAEACLECHGTKVAYYMGINYTDASGNLVSYPAKELTIKNTQAIATGTVVFNASTGAWDPAVINLTVPAGTIVSTYTDAVNEPRYQVKTLVKLPDGRIYASYDYAGATATGVDPDPAKKAEARNWIYAALQAMALDGLDYTFTKTEPGQPYEGTGYNWPTVEAQELCNQCHDPMSTSLRIIKKSLIEGIARNGINPYSMKGSLIKDFNQASRQDQIIAVCAQCHSEYVGGYSAVDSIDRNFFPWARPDEVETLYQNLFNYNQDWSHGKPIRPWQNTTPNARGYYPDESLYPINETLTKSQHPEAEMFWNSVMYDAGATCTTCHSIKKTNATSGRQYTSHWFTSPIKLIDNEGVQSCDNAGCHGPGAVNINPGGPIGKPDIKLIQDVFFDQQNQTQLALAERLRIINQSKLNGTDVTQEVADFKKSHLRWEYFAEAENSMGFHNFLLSKNDMNAALYKKWSVKGATYAPTQGTPGLTIPTAVWLGDAATGSLWESDQVLGFCRVDNIGGIFDVDQNTCILGDGAGLVPGPMIPAQASFDAANNIVYVPDMDAVNINLVTGIWKMDYDPATKTVVNPVLIANVSMLGFLDAQGKLVGEPVASALGFDGSLYIGSAVSPYIVKITNPGTPAQTIISNWGTVANPNNFVSSLAFAGTDLYVAETSLVSKITSAGGTATILPNTLSLVAPTAITSDGNNILYIGDTKINSFIKRYTISTSTLDSVPYATTGIFSDGSTTPFQFIASLSLDSAGNLYVADDPGNDPNVIEPPFFGGRVWKVTPASAPSGTQYHPIYTPGISMPGGLVWMDDLTNGNMWIADGWLGLCRLDKNATGVALINASTCLAGDGYTAPMAPTHPVFDPATNFLYVPDMGATVPDMIGVWRYTYDPATKTLINGVPLFTNAQLGAIEPIASALGPDGSLYIGFLERTGIVKITNPGTSPTVSDFGTVMGPAAGVFDIAIAGQYLYLAEPNGITRIPLSTGGQAAAFSTKLINPATMGFTDVLPASMISDGVNLYIAEMPMMESPIQLYNISTDIMYPYSTTGVLPDGRIMPYRAAYAMGFDPAGNLYVADDPTNDITAQAFKGRVFIVPSGAGAVQPLSVAISESPDPVASGGTSQVTVHVTTTGGFPVSGVTVEVSATAGSLSAAGGTTDYSGNLLLTYTAPAATGTYVISANASMAGYLSGSGSDAITVVQPSIVSSIVVTPSSATLIVGGTQKFNATTKDQNGNPVAGINISWTSSNPSAAGITPSYGITGADGNASATVLAIATGTATITAANGTVGNVSTVTVNPAPPVMVISPNGGEYWTTGTTQVIRWNYSYPATPQTKVLIELVKGPALEIKRSWEASIGTAGSGSYSWAIPANEPSGSDYKIKVTIKDTTNWDYSDNYFSIGSALPALNVAVSEIPDPVISGGLSQVTVHVGTAGGTNVSGADVVVTATGGSLSAPGGATDASGNLVLTYTAPSVAVPTTYTISANASKTGYLNGSGSDPITVTPPPVLSTIAVTPSASTVVVGGTRLLTATAKDQYGSPMSGIRIDWTSSNISVGTIAPASSVTGADGNASATFSAVAAGTATVSATSGGVIGTSAMTVNPAAATNTYPLTIDPITGKTTTTVIGTSPFGNATLTIPNGTKATDAGGEALTNVSITSNTTLSEDAYFALSTTNKEAIGGDYLTLGPAGAKFDPPILLRFNYTEPLPAGVTEATLQIAYFNTVKGSWEPLEVVSRDMVQNYIIVKVAHFSEFAVLGATPVAARVDIKPDALSKASKSDKSAITAFIEIPGYDVNAIDVSTVVLTTSRGSVYAQLSPTRVGDYDNDGTPDRMVKFDRQAVIAILDIGDKVRITITDEVAGKVYEGSDYIKVTAR